MNILDETQSLLADAFQKWRSLGQIAPLALGFFAGLSVTLIL